MKRSQAYFGLGGALVAAALLAACGGGGAGATNSIPVPSTTAQAKSSGLRLTFVVPRNVKHRSAKLRANQKRRAYVSTGAEGMQLSITPSGGATTTLYADLTSTVLCQAPVNGSEPNGSETVCTITLPVLGASETVTATVTNIEPSGVNATTGFGTGFSSGGNVLGVGSTTVNTTGGTQTIALGIGPVAAKLYDCEGYLPAAPDPSHFADDFDEDNGNTARVVVTSGVTTSGYLSQEFEDPANDWYDALPTPAPGFSPAPNAFVDVNGSPTPITYTASSSDITLGLATAVTSTGSPEVYATPSSLASSGSIATDADYLNDCAFYSLVKVNALPTPAPGASPPTITFANNLTASAASPFTGGPYGTTLVYTVVPIAPSSTTSSVTMGNTATVSGSDYDANDQGMDAESAYGAEDENCYDTTNTSTVDATVAPGTMNTTTWLQPFTITPVADGTCTVLLYDVDTGVVTAPITVTVSG